MIIQDDDFLTDEEERKIKNEKLVTISQVHRETLRYDQRSYTMK